MKLLGMVKDMEIKHSVSSPKKYGVTFFSKKFMGECFTWGLTSDHPRREQKFHKCISSNFAQFKSENFPGHGGRHLKKIPNQCLEIWKDLSLRLMVKRFQRSSQVQFPSC